MSSGIPSSEQIGGRKRPRPTGNEETDYLTQNVMRNELLPLPVLLNQVHAFSDFQQLQIDRRDIERVVETMVTKVVESEKDETIKTMKEAYEIMKKLKDEEIRKKKEECNEIVSLCQRKVEEILASALDNIGKSSEES